MYWKNLSEKIYLVQITQSRGQTHYPMVSLKDRSTPVNTPSPALGMVDLARYSLHLFKLLSSADALEHKIGASAAVAFATFVRNSIL